MAIEDKNRIYDGWVSLEAGVDAGRQSNMLQPNQCESSINGTFRGGEFTARPGFRRMEQQFAAANDQVYVYNTPNLTLDRIIGEYAANLAEAPDPTMLDGSQTVYQTGKFQRANVYNPHNGEDCIMALVGGRLFKIVPGVTTAKVREVPIHGKEVFPATESNSRNLRNMKDRSIAYMVQADKWLIAQDGISSAIIYDSNKARRSITDVDVDHTEIPVGTIMAYGNGRLVVIVNDNRDVAFGDLYGSHDLPDPADSIILFTERNFLAEGFDASIPFEKGKATGAAFFPQLDTSTGNGQLMVFAQRGANSFFTSLPRDQWKTSQFQIHALTTTGLRGDKTIASVNEDLWFRSDDGARSYRQARSEQGGWAHIPLSTNVKQYFKNDSDWMLKYGSAIYFDNRIIFTASPMPYQGRTMHWSMVAVDFDIISSFGTSSKPAWEGAWQMSSFVFPIQLLTGEFNGVTRAFLFAIDNENKNQLFELSKDDVTDWDNQPINFELISRFLDFQKFSPQSTPFTENELYAGDFWLEDIT